MEKVIIVGSSGHAKVVIDIFEKTENHQIIGLIDSFRSVGEKTLGHSIIGGDKDLPQLVSKFENVKFFIAIGDNFVRKKVFDSLSTIIPKNRFAKAIHPSAQIAKSVQIGNGTAIMAGAVINSDSTIGDFCIANTNSSIDHDCSLSSFSSVAPGSTLGGNINIGSGSAISIGATLLNKITIGDNSIIGAGSVITKSFGDNVVVYGVPGKEIRSRKEGEKYL